MNSIAEMIGRSAGGAGGGDEPTGPAVNPHSESALEAEGESGPLDVEAMRAQLDATDHPDSLRALAHSILDAHEAHVNRAGGGGEQATHHRSFVPEPDKPASPAPRRPSAPERKPVKPSGKYDGRRYDTSTNTYR